MVGGELFIKKEWLRMLVCFHADDKSCVGIGSEFLSGDTWPHAHGFGRNDTVSG